MIVDNKVTPSVKAVPKRTVALLHGLCQNANKLKVEKFFPATVLLPFVREFLIIESDGVTDGKTLPDTSMIMAFRYKGGITRTDNGKSLTLPAAALAGLRRSARCFSYTRHTANLLVIFAPGGINAFTRLPAHELFEQHIPAENIFSSAKLKETMQRLAEAATHRDRIDLIQSFLLQHLVNTSPDPLIGRALQLIRQHNGSLKIKELASSLYISQDAFEKRFRSTVGAAPKQYASIVRLRSLITKAPSQTSLTKAAYDAGYFDQSHFIKDFRLFTGQTPGDFFRSGQYW